MLLPHQTICYQYRSLLPNNKREPAHQKSKRKKAKSCLSSQSIAHGQQLHSSQSTQPGSPCSSVHPPSPLCCHHLFVRSLMPSPTLPLICAVPQLVCAVPIRLPPTLSHLFTLQSTVPSPPVCTPLCPHMSHPLALHTCIR